MSTDNFGNTTNGESTNNASNQSSNNAESNGTTGNVAVYYALDNTTSDVEVEVTDWLELNNAKLTKIFKLKK